MTDLVPRSFFNFPRIPSLWEEEDDLWAVNSPTSGLTVSEDASSVYVEAQIPGIDPDKIEVTYDKGVLWIRGTKEQEEKGRKFYKKASNSFSYRVAVPGDVDEKEEPRASYKNGVMKVSFRKRPEVKPKKIEVKKE